MVEGRGGWRGEKACTAACCMRSRDRLSTSSPGFLCTLTSCLPSPFRRTSHKFERVMGQVHQGCDIERGTPVVETGDLKRSILNDGVGATLGEHPAYGRRLAYRITRKSDG